jgi:hypothetical protein
MGVGTAVHYIGSFLLFVALVLTIVVDITTPVTSGVYLMQWDGSGDASAKLGLWGYCTTSSSGSETCSSRRLGYNPAMALDGVNAADFSNAREDTTRALTKAFVVQPVGSGVLLLAFISSLLFTGSTIGGICATLISAGAFIINTIAAIILWVTMSLLRNEINDHGNGKARYAAALYLSPVAAALALVGTIIMLVTCCAGRRKRKYAGRTKPEY